MQHTEQLDIQEVHVYAMLLLECCFTSTETVGLLGTGAQDGHLDFHTAPAGLYEMLYPGVTSLYSSKFQTRCSFQVVSRSWAVAPAA